MPVPASPVPTMVAAPTGMAASTVHVYQDTRAAPVGLMWMNVGCLVYASMGVLASIPLAPSAASARLATLGRSVRASPHPVLPLSASMGALVARQGTSAMSVLACLVSETCAVCCLALL